MKFEDWSPEEDQFLKAGEIELHQFLHKSRSETVQASDQILRTKQIRWKNLERRIDSIGGFGGSFLEVGAGDGWCSAALLKYYNASQAYIMEVDKAAIERLIPNTLKSFGVEGKDITLVRGSFNEIQKLGYFDFVIAMGALHHSQNLSATLLSIYRALKPGGYVLSQEPSMPDETPNSYFFDRENQSTKFQEGIEFENADRTDLFYRECEYRTAFLHAGFDIEIENLLSVKQNESIFSKVKKAIVGERESTSELMPEPLFFVARKPLEELDRRPPTAWGGN